jgi:AAA domain
VSRFPVEPAWRLAARAEEQRWLVTGLWSEEAVGIIGGEPKCCKSFLALDLAVAVAAGIPCLRRFGVPRAGRVLLYAAEDALHVVRQRLEGICAAAGLALADLDVQVITAPAVRLDLQADRASLDETVAALRPRLLVLDPFVRLHRIDENASGEVAPYPLGWLSRCSSQSTMRLTPGRFISRTNAAQSGSARRRNPGLEPARAKSRSSSTSSLSSSGNGQLSPAAFARSR